MTNFQPDMSNFSMLELFGMEVETQVAILNENLLALETFLTQTIPEEDKEKMLSALMRAAHSIKGAARIVQIEPAVKIAHFMEDCFVGVQAGNISLSPDQIDVLLAGVDLLLGISQVGEPGLDNWLAEHNQEIGNTISAIAAILGRRKTDHEPPQKDTANSTPKAPSQQQAIAPSSQTDAEVPSPKEAIAPTSETDTEVPSQQQIAGPESQSEVTVVPTTPDRVLRVSRENLNRLMGLAGEALVDAKWFDSFADSLLQLKKRQGELSQIIEKLQGHLPDLNYQGSQYLQAAVQKHNECAEMLADRLNEVELFSSRSANLSDRLYREVIASHMRPFADGVESFPRMVRDLARQLHKQVKLEIIGSSTPVDRDILQKLEAPLTHIIRNAIDHGIELPQERKAAGKPETGTVRLEAVHRAGMLSIIVADDGNGIGLEKLRSQIVTQKLATAEMATQLTENELMEFLFLPGFSTADRVTEISGRGVGLDVAKSMVQEVGGTLRAISHPGEGMSFHFQLPLTLSVIRTLLVEISGETFAFPLTRIEQVLKVPKDKIYLVENQQYFIRNEQNIGLVAAHQVLELTPSATFNSELLPVIVIGDRLNYYGLVVERFLGERDLVVRPLDPRLGKVRDISAAALREDGSLVLIVDVADLVRSIDNLLGSKQLHLVSQEETSYNVEKQQKIILVVDDSITVREMERKLLENNGYQVEVAVDGMDGWNAVRTGNYDLIITDVDMPRMDGIELVNQIKTHPNLKSTPVIIVSYKDREEDRIRGMEAGADYYLTKSSFHDDSLIDAVRDVIG
ncbi:MAG: response regulator [Hormoscilla sp.]